MWRNRPSVEPGHLPRIADALCRRCTEATLRGPFDYATLQRWRAIDRRNFYDCTACFRRYTQLIDQFGPGFPWRPHLDSWAPQMRRRSTAVHEAAHATAGLVFGDPIRRAWLADDQAVEPNGMVEYHSHGRKATGREVAAHLVIGLLAQRRWIEEHVEGREADLGAPTADADWIDIVRGVKGDLAVIDAVLGGMPSGAMGIAKTIIATKWQEILDLAAELDRRGEMNAEQLHAATGITGRIPALADPAGDRPATTTTTTTTTAGAPAPVPAPTSGGPAMSNIDEIRAVLHRAVDETEHAHAALMQAAQRLDSARAAVAHAAQSSSRDEIQQVLGRYGHTTAALTEAGGHLAAVGEEIRTYTSSL